MSTKPDLHPKYIQFQVIFNTGKTFIWQVARRDKGPTILGHVRWFPRWRRYCFYPHTDTVYEQDCLRDIATLCEDQTRKHYSKFLKRGKNVGNQETKSS